MASVELDDKGTLWVTTDDVEKVHRVIVTDDKSHWCLTFYTSEAVVRCKDCKHSFGELATRGGVWSTDDKHLFCQMTKHLMRVDDFCSWGERREDA